LLHHQVIVHNPLTIWKNIYICLLPTIDSIEAQRILYDLPSSIIVFSNIIERRHYYHVIQVPRFSLGLSKKQHIIMVFLPVRMSELGKRLIANVINMCLIDVNVLLYLF